MDIKFLGKIISYDPLENILSLKLDFVTPNKEAVIEDIIKNKNSFTFWITKPFRREKSWEQLKTYFHILKKILVKEEFYPSSVHVKTLDEYIKRTCCECNYISFNDGGEIKKIPLVPSKADMSVEELSELIQKIMDRYKIQLD